MEFLTHPLVSSFSSVKLMLILLGVYVCCLWLLSSFSSDSSLLSSVNFLPSTVMNSVASSPISFFCLRLLHMDCGSYGLSIRMDHCLHTNCQSIWIIWILNPYIQYRKKIKKKSRIHDLDNEFGMMTNINYDHTLLDEDNKEELLIEEKMRKFKRRMKMVWMVQPTDSQSIV